MTIKLQPLFVVGILATGLMGSASGENSLSAVRSISISPLKEHRDLERQLAAQLVRDTSLRLETPGNADAHLEGQAAIWVRGYRSLSPRARTNDAYAEPVYTGYLSVMLKHKAGEVLWSYFAYARTAGSRSEVTKDLASQVSSELSTAVHQSTVFSSPSQVTAHAKAVTLRGGGATFPFPIYERWLTSFAKADPSTTITYDPVGSTAGVERFSAGEFDFAGSDVPLSVLKSRRSSLAFPTVAGAVALVYNLPAFSGDLRLTPEVLAAILQGRIAKWNDPQLTSLNRGSALPNQPIHVVHRSDGSGTTFVLTHFLSQVVPDWQKRMGEGDRMRWPVGEAASGNDGVAAFIEKTRYSLGYTEFVFAFRRQLSIAAIRNAAGHFVQPDLPGIAAAAADVTNPIPVGFDLSLTNARGRQAYPISSFTWLVIPKTGEIDAEKSAALKRLLEWILGSGQRQAMALGYVPLPKLLLEEELKAVQDLN